MKETGRIREIRESTVIIQPDLSAACFGCMNQACKSGGFISAENKTALPLKPGQIVEVYVPGAGVFQQTLIALLPPALGFIIGFVLTRLLFPEAGEGAAGISGVVLLFAAGFIVYLARRKNPAKKECTVTRILE